MERDALEIKREALRLTHLCETALAWDAEDVLVPVQQAAEQVQRTYARLSSGECAIFSQEQTVFEDARQAAAALSDALAKAAHQLGDKVAELQQQLTEKQTALADLRRNIKDYPRGLLPFRAKLAEELEQQAGVPVAVDILADVLEIEDERWRGAVEGYLNNQKFYFLVEPAYYEQALRIYNKLKWEKSLNAYGLVDIGTLREREHIDPQSGSLAEKVETGNALARTYMDYLLGRVMCCDTVEQLRGHRTAITDEGMLYQGYVARALRRDRMEDAFIGRHAVTLRIARLEEEAAGLQAEYFAQETHLAGSFSAENAHADAILCAKYRTAAAGGFSVPRGIGGGDQRDRRAGFPSRPAVAGSAEAAYCRNQRRDCGAESSA